jgi:DNA-binding transcriptional MerR regulator
MGCYGTAVEGIAPRMAARSERPLFSIGAVGRMLDLSPATMRTWETRYELVVPTRSSGGQRLYTRAQVDQLRFVIERLAEGRRPGEAHRLLAERIGLGETFSGERFEVVVIDDPDVAIRTIEELEPMVVVLDTSDERFRKLEKSLRAAGTTVLPFDVLEQPLSLLIDRRT